MLDDPLPLLPLAPPLRLWLVCWNSPNMLFDGLSRTLEYPPLKLSFRLIWLGMLLLLLLLRPREWWLEYRDEVSSMWRS
jgi:hypothetical protein